MFFSARGPGGETAPRVWEPVYQVSERRQDRTYISSAEQRRGDDEGSWREWSDGGAVGNLLSSRTSRCTILSVPFALWRRYLLTFISVIASSEGRRVRTYARRRVAIAVAATDTCCGIDLNTVSAEQSRSRVRGGSPGFMFTEWINIARYLRGVFVISDNSQNLANSFLGTVFPDTVSVKNACNDNLNNTDTQISTDMNNTNMGKYLQIMYKMECSFSNILSTYYFANLIYVL